MTTYLQGVSQTGIWDGSGNVWEWMHNPPHPGGDTRARRGGAWSSNARFARASSRNDYAPDDFDVNVGLRVAVSPVFGPSGS